SRKGRSKKKEGHKKKQKDVKKKREKATWKRDVRKRRLLTLQDAHRLDLGHLAPDAGGVHHVHHLRHVLIGFRDLLVHGGTARRAHEDAPRLELLRDVARPW